MGWQPMMQSIKLKLTLQSLRLKVSLLNRQPLTLQQPKLLLNLVLKRQRVNNPFDDLKLAMPDELKLKKQCVNVALLALHLSVIVPPGGRKLVAEDSRPWNIFFVKSSCPRELVWFTISQKK